MLTEAAFIDFDAGWADEGVPLIGGDGARAYYRLGYFNCARAAADSLRRRKGMNKSAMPILFLYRHYLEIAIKDALHASNAFDLEQSNKKFRHDLSTLWVEAKRVLSAFVDQDWLSEMDVTVDEFDKLDKKADAFRYPVDSNGKDYFPSQGKVVLNTLIKRMDAAKTVLEHIIKEIRIEERELDRAIAEAVAKDPF